MSAPPSFTATFFTKEDEERELKELTDIEKEAILDDKYGRRRNGTNSAADTTTSLTGARDMGGGNDVSDELIQQFYDAIEEIPSDKNGFLIVAWAEAEEVVQRESDPQLFLRCENYDPKRAALRQCKYWEWRYEIALGKEDAIKPMTLHGAMKDVVPYMVQIPNFFRILPDDDQGRTVVCLDRTGMKLKDYDDLVLAKITWFVFHKALEKQSTQENGVVLVVINQTMCWDFPSTKFLKLALHSYFDIIPVKMCCIHACVSSLPATVLAPIVKYIMSRYARLRLQMHNSLNKPKMLSDLESFGLRRDNLPKSIGGSYDEKATWIDECERILKKQKRLRQDKRPRI